MADFLYEVGTLRKIPRIHSQALFVEDASDNIATHSYRTALIGYVLAKKEGVDPNKVTTMCLLHDLDETRSNDHNWIHKRYVKVFGEEILNEQLGTLPFEDFEEVVKEYEKRESKESIVAKDADILDQLLLLREYEMQGNKEAERWLYGSDKKEMLQIKKLKLDSSKRLGEAIYAQAPSNWWDGLYTNENR